MNGSIKQYSNEYMYLFINLYEISPQSLSFTVLHIEMFSFTKSFCFEFISKLKFRNLRNFILLSLDFLKWSITPAINFMYDYIVIKLFLQISLHRRHRLAMYRHASPRLLVCVCMSAKRWGTSLSPSTRNCRFCWRGESTIEYAWTTPSSSTRLLTVLLRGLKELRWAQWTAVLSIPRFVHREGLLW